MKLRNEAKNYIGTHYFPDKPLGSVVDGWRNENIEATTFPDESFDLVVSLDVTEHVFNPDDKFKDIWRTLKSNGVYISTFPIKKSEADASRPLALLGSDGKISFLKEPPEYHGNPIDGKGALVTWEFGYDIHQQICEWAPFAVEISRFCDRFQGILGEYTEVVVCRKR